MDEESLRSAFKDAVESGDLEKVKELAAAKPDLANFPLQGRGWRTDMPVTAAAIEGQAEIVAFLLEIGGDAMENCNFPLAQAAVRDGNEAAMEVLVANGADINRVCNDYGPPLLWAVEGCALGNIAWLLDRGAQITGSGPSENEASVPWNVLKHAGYFNKRCPGMLALLLERGAAPNSEVADQQGHPELANSALHNAAEKGDIKGVRVLLEYGADPQAKNAEGKRPVDLTRNKKVSEVLEKT